MLFTATTESVKDALKMAAHLLHQIGAQHEEHGKKNMEPMLDYLFTYKGIYANIPDIINVHKVLNLFNFHTRISFLKLVSIFW